MVTPDATHGTPIVLSEHDRQHFAHWGLLRLEQCLPPVLVEAARDRVRRRLERVGLWRDGAWQLADADPRAGPIAGHALVEGLKKSDAFAALVTDDLLRAMTALVEGRTLSPMASHPQLLFTLPNATTWTVPATIWHLDMPRLPAGGVPGVQLFTFLEPVLPGGGGTLVVAGSHRLLNTGRFIRSKDVKARLKRWPYFRELMAKDATDRSRFVREVGRVDDVELQVVELCGQPGDLYLTDLRLLHTLAPNAARVPRIMLTQRFWLDATREAAQAGFGWDTPARSATVAS